MFSEENHWYWLIYQKTWVWDIKTSSFALYLTNETNSDHCEKKFDHTSWVFSSVSLTTCRFLWHPVFARRKWWKKIRTWSTMPEYFAEFQPPNICGLVFFPNNSKQRPNKYSVFQLRMKLFTKKLQHFLALKNCFINIKLTWSNGHEIILGLTRTEHTEKVLASSRITSSEVCDWSFEFHQGIFHNKKNETLWFKWTKH